MLLCVQFRAQGRLHLYSLLYSHAGGELPSRCRFLHIYSYSPLLLNHIYYPIPQLSSYASLPLCIYFYSVERITLKIHFRGGFFSRLPVHNSSASLYFPMFHGYWHYFNFDLYWLCWFSRSLTAHLSTGARIRTANPFPLLASFHSLTIRYSLEAYQLILILCTK